MTEPRGWTGNEKPEGINMNKIESEAQMTAVDPKALIDQILDGIWTSDTNGECHQICVKAEQALDQLSAYFVENIEKDEKILLEFIDDICCDHGLADTGRACCAHRLQIVTAFSNLVTKAKFGAEQEKAVRVKVLEMLKTFNELGAQSFMAKWPKSLLAKELQREYQKTERASWQ